MQTTNILTMKTKKRIMKNTCSKKLQKGKLCYTYKVTTYHINIKTVMI